MKKSFFSKIGAFTAAAVVMVSASGCTFGGDRIMVSESYLEENYVKNIVVKGAGSGGEVSVQLWNWVVRVCDINKETAVATDCVDTTVMDNVYNYSAVR